MLIYLGKLLYRSPKSSLSKRNLLLKAISPKLQASRQSLSSTEIKLDNLILQHQLKLINADWSLGETEMKKRRPFSYRLLEKCGFSSA